MVVRPLPAIFWRLAAIGLAAAALAACQASDIPKQLKPVPRALVAEMDKLDMKATSPIFIRIFKEESTLEVWKQRRDGQFALLEAYDICKWSGELGPKKQEGDRQAPEGFYMVTASQMNPKSSYYLSFNIGYPNAFDRSLGRTGSNLMVHGACSSAGCYSMTDEDAGELFALARDSFRGGQQAFQIQAFPFRMTAENLARHRDDPNMDFWRMLKVGYDSFELTQQPPKVDVCEKRYVFNADAGTARFEASAACPAYQVPDALALASKQAADDQTFAQAVAALQLRDRQAAETSRLAAAKAAEKEQRATVKQSSPSPLSRWFGSGGKAAPKPPAPVAAVAPAAAAASVPVPTPAPRVVTAPVPPAPLPAPPVAAAQAPEPAVPAGTGALITPEMTPQSLPVGTFVKRKFWWPDDTAEAAPDGPG